MSSPTVIGATVVAPHASGATVLLDDGTRREVSVEGVDANRLRTGQRLEVVTAPDGSGVAHWPAFTVQVTPRR